MDYLTYMRVEQDLADRAHQFRRHHQPFTPTRHPTRRRAARGLRRIADALDASQPD